MSKALPHVHIFILILVKDSAQLDGKHAFSSAHTLRCNVVMDLNDVQNVQLPVLIYIKHFERHLTSNFTILAHYGNKSLSEPEKINFHTINALTQVYVDEFCNYRAVKTTEDSREIFKNLLLGNGAPINEARPITLEVVEPLHQNGMNMG